ncbi:MAG: hypothetical protein ACRDOW_02595 [Nocardioidaceae bacterium]
MFGGGTQRWLRCGVPLRAARRQPADEQDPGQRQSHSLSHAVHASQRLLARLGEASGTGGVNIDGFAVFTGDGKGVAGVNVDLAYTTFGGVRLVFGTDDMRVARSVLEA